EMLAAIQLLVYAGAVVVLFIFVIMLIGPSAGTVPFEDGTSFGLNRLVLRSLAGTLAAMAFLPILMAVTTYDPAPPSVELCRTTDCVDLGSVDGVGQALFTNAIIPFLVVALTLTVAVVGALAMARGRTPEEITEAKRRRAEREARAARGQGKTSVAEVVA
ncbi:MAG: NADH-quinone oxidoreductase subunit J, partial [Myxococcota bacterium]